MGLISVPTNVVFVGICICKNYRRRGSDRRHDVVFSSVTGAVMIETKQNVVVGKWYAFSIKPIPPPEKWEIFRLFGNICREVPSVIRTEIADGTVEMKVKMRLNREKLKAGESPETGSIRGKTLYVWPIGNVAMEPYFCEKVLNQVEMFFANLLITDPLEHVKRKNEQINVTARIRLFSDWVMALSKNRNPFRVLWFKKIAFKSDGKVLCEDVEMPGVPRKWTVPFEQLSAERRQKKLMSSQGIDGNWRDR